VIQSREPQINIKIVNSFIRRCSVLWLFFFLMVGCRERAPFDLLIVFGAQKPSGVITEKNQMETGRNGGVIFVSELSLQGGAFDEIVKNGFGIFKIPTTKMNFSTGFLGYEFDTGINPDILVFSEETTRELRQMICDVKGHKVIMMKQMK
jgi:hypothetical protein